MPCGMIINCLGDDHTASLPTNNTSFPTANWTVTNHVTGSVDQAVNIAVIIPSITAVVLTCVDQKTMHARGFRLFIDVGLTAVEKIVHALFPSPMHLHMHARIDTHQWTHKHRFHAYPPPHTHTNTHTRERTHARTHTAHGRAIISAQSPIC